MNDIPIEKEHEGKEEMKESIGEFIGNIFISMLFPFMVLWFGPKYLVKKMYIKGIIIICLVVTEVILVGKWKGYF